MSLLGAIAPWFGGKRTLAPHIVQELGPHQAYFEPFCGSCAVLFAKPVSSLETVNDLHGDLVNLAFIIASDRWNELYERVDRVLLAQDLIDSFVAGSNTDIVPPSAVSKIMEHHLERAAGFLAASWICRNGCAGTLRVNYQIAVRWTSGGGSPGIRWRSAVDSVPYWHDRLKGVLILNRDGFDVIERVADEVGTVLYVDPPYFKATRSDGGGSAYLHDFSEDESPMFGGTDDHRRLASALRRFQKTRVVVSYYDSPRLADLYVGWTRRDLARRKNLAAQNKRGACQAVAPEVLLINGASRA